jgi:hypothetical protein
MRKQTKLFGSAVISLAAMKAFPVQAADLQKSGKVEFDADVTYRTIQSLDNGFARGTILEYGLDRRPPEMRPLTIK